MLDARHWVAHRVEDDLRTTQDAGLARLPFVRGATTQDLFALRVPLTGADAPRHLAYIGLVALVQIRDVPDATVNALRAQAAEQGLTLATYLPARLDRLACHRRTRRSSSG